MGYSWQGELITGLTHERLNKTFVHRLIDHHIKWYAKRFFPLFGRNQKGRHGKATSVVETQLTLTRDGQQRQLLTRYDSLPAECTLIILRVLMESNQNGWTKD